MPRPWSEDLKIGKRFGPDGTLTSKSPSSSVTTPKGTNMFQITENVLHREKENAKKALEEFWAIKNSVDAEGSKVNLEHVDQLINYHQLRLDTLRKKEDQLIKVSQDSQKLIIEKSKQESELNHVNQDLQDVEGELQILQRKLIKLKARKNELVTKAQETTNDLQRNEDEVIGGLSDITLLGQITLMSKKETPSPADQVEAAEAKDIPASTADTPEREALEKIKEEKKPEVATELLQKKEQEATMPFPYQRSVVKTQSGKVIGQYYYDPQVSQKYRNYIFNGRYVMGQLDLGLEILKEKFDEVLFAHMIQMLSDGMNRITKKDNIHFEISTNEIINGKSLAEIVVALKSRDYHTLDLIVRKYQAKVEALGINHKAMLVEQMERFKSN